MKFESINPHNGEKITTYSEQSEQKVQGILSRAERVFPKWMDTPLEERTGLLRRAGDILRKQKELYARLMTLEMGKPITEARSEIEKCAWVCDYYAEHAAQFLADQPIETDASESYVSCDPLGTVLAIMPWNFPFWQVFRFAAPTLTAGNTAILKHAPNVFGCARAIEELFLEAGYPKGVFQNLIVHHDNVEKVIEHEAIKAVTLTGSERAGRAVAAAAGKNLKKSLLELGGSNAFVVLEDADMMSAVETAISARMMNSGQSCIAGKRFILVGEAYDRFLPLFIEKVNAIRSGNPLDEKTQMGPLARKDLADQLHQQLVKSVEMGAIIEAGGKQRGAFHEPTVLTGVQPGMPAFDEETFGPLAAVIKAADEEEAYSLAANSSYGLGMTVFTSDIEKAKRNGMRVPDGAFFVNELVKSDPRLPFGGTKLSGYGRELSREGILEFVNKKTVYIK
jgi:succinate-semialdehyde dehydrogenase / glutarate-semialdehyde dehydrogenase